MKEFKFEKGVVVSEKYGEYSFYIKNGELFLNNELYNNEMYEKAENKYDLLTALKRVIEKYNTELEIIEEKKDEINKLQKSFNNITCEWSELKDLRKKEANELKEITLKKLNFLAEELANNGMWNDVRIGTVDYYDYGRTDCIYNERTVLEWCKDGYYFIYEEKNNNGFWKEREKLYNVKKFESIEELNNSNIKRLAENLPKRIKELTKSLKNEVIEIQNLIKSFD